MFSVFTQPIFYIEKNGLHQFGQERYTIFMKNLYNHGEKSLIFLIKQLERFVCWCDVSVRVLDNNFGFLNYVRLAAAVSWRPFLLLS